ncbi:MAG: tetratricopeptide repeat protein [Flavobacteriales bacterium]|nr:tetratricopeptide repeat protein [Flavobacteriales bacterium]
MDTLTRLFLTHEGEEVRRFARTVRAQYHYNSGYQAKFKRDIPGALGHFEKSCSLSKDLGNLVHLVGSYEALGSLYRSVGEPQLALAYYQEALPLVDPVGDPPRETTLRIAMASAYCDIRRYDLAEDQLALCDTSMPEVHPNVLEGMAYLLEAKGQRAHALKKLDRAAQVMALDPEPWGYIGVYSPMARMKMAGGDHAGALEAASACREVAAGTGDEAGWCTCSILAGEAELALGNSTRAETLLRSALDTARFHGYLGLARETGDEGSMVQAAALLRDIYMRQNRLKEAVEMTTYWSELKDTLNPWTVGWKYPGPTWAQGAHRQP